MTDAVTKKEAHLTKKELFEAITYENTNATLRLSHPHLKPACYHRQVLPPPKIHIRLAQQTYCGICHPSQMMDHWEVYWRKRPFDH
ncbi:MAG: hypothetical protein RIR11_1950, partial [Bacteroidota bacterium]